MEQKGFFGRLFDISFTSFVTTSIIKLLYVLTLIGIGIVALVLIAAGFEHGTGTGVVVLVIVAPLVALIWATYARVLFEVVIVFFRIMETNQEQVELLRGQADGMPTVPTVPPAVD